MIKHFICDSVLGNDLTEIKLPTCHLRADRTVRAERPLCPKVVGWGGGGVGDVLTGVQSKDDCRGIVICHQMSSTH